MSTADDRPEKLFTVEQANAMLPLVRAIATDFSALATEIIERRQRLAHLMGGRERFHSDLYGDELAQIQDELEKDAVRLQEYVEELRRLGVQPKGADGLVDFPSRMDGRVVYLCWRLGEPELLYWHELDGGFAGRQPLTAESVAGDDGDNGNGGHYSP
jgi:hypothetical protein